MSEASPLQHRPNALALVEQAVVVRVNLALARGLALIAVVVIAARAVWALLDYVHLAAASVDSVADQDAVPAARLALIIHAPGCRSVLYYLSTESRALIYPLRDLACSTSCASKRNIS
jgi:hypothetical protein